MSIKNENSKKTDHHCNKEENNDMPENHTNNINRNGSATVQRKTATVNQESRCNGKLEVNISKSQSIKTAIGIDELLDEVMNLEKKKRTISEILEYTLSNIEEKDFREEAEFTEEDKTLSRKHYLVLVIEYLIEKTKALNLDIVFKDGKIYIYNGQFWEVILESDFNYFLGQFALKMGVDKFEAKFFKFKEDLYKQFISESNLKHIKPKNNSTLINLNNGTFEISDNHNQLREFRKQDFLTYQLPFDYNPEASTDLWDKFLNSVLPEKELQHLLAEYIGSIFIKNEVLKFEKALFLYGTGSNGKSVVFDIIRSLLGTQNFSSYSLDSLMYDKDSRAMIADKLLNYSSEMGSKVESDIFKKLVSREPIDARLLYKSSFIMEDYARLMFNCNELPSDIEHTNAFFRRFIIIPFRTTIKEEDQDRQLSQKIIADELPGVFNWMLSGMLRLLKNQSFTKSTIVEDEVKRFRRESDSALNFLDERNYVKSPSTELRLQEFYNEYRMFCIENGNSPCSNKNFSKRIKNEGFETKRKNTGMFVFAEKKDLNE